MPATARPPEPSGTPQARKLGLRPGVRVALDRAPSGWSLTEPPLGVLQVGPRAQVDVVVAFFREAAELPRRLPPLAERIRPSGALWVAWPRRAGGHPSDLGDRVIREVALPLGIVDVKVAMIDEDWSGLKLVWRLTNR